MTRAKTEPRLQDLHSPSVFRVIWRSSITGKSGHGDNLPREVADFVAETMTAEFGPYGFSYEVEAVR